MLFCVAPYCSKNQLRNVKERNETYIHRNTVFIWLSTQPCIAQGLIIIIIIIFYFLFFKFFYWLTISKCTPHGPFLFIVIIFCFVEK